MVKTMYYIYSYARPDRYAARKETLGEAKKAAKTMRKERGGQHYYIERREIIYTTKTIEVVLPAAPAVVAAVPQHHF
jgi:hypothetical protein